MSFAGLITVGADFGAGAVRLAVPVAYFVPLDARGTSDRWALGDLILEGLVALEIGAEHRLRIGGGLAIPTATDMPAPCVSYERCPGTSGTRLRAWSTSWRDAPAWADQSFSLWPTIDYTLGIPWFLLRAIGTAPVFFPLDPLVGGPQPLARGRVELMLTLDVAVAVRVLEVVDVGTSFLGWAIPTGAGAVIDCGGACADRTGTDPG